MDYKSKVEHKGEVRLLVKGLIIKILIGRGIARLEFPQKGALEHEEDGRLMLAPFVWWNLVRKWELRARREGEEEEEEERKLLKRLG